MIVSNVIYNKKRLSWEPMVMCRDFKEKRDYKEKKEKNPKEVSVMDRRNGKLLNISSHKLCTAYEKEGCNLQDNPS